MNRVIRKSLQNAVREVQYGNTIEERKTEREGERERGRKKYIKKSRMHSIT